MTPLNRLFIALLMAAFIGLPSAARADQVPSCMDLVEGLSAPGAVGPCAPPAIEADLSYELWRVLGLKRFGHDYVAVRSDWDQLSSASLWEGMVDAVGALQTLRGENADVYFLRPPTTEAQKAAARLGEVPDDLIVAHGRYDWPATERAASAAFPLVHHRRLYLVIVNGP